MRFSSALLVSLSLVSATHGFQPAFRVVSTQGRQQSTHLFMADEIKDYKKGLSKITGQGDSSSKVCRAVLNPVSFPFSRIFLSASYSPLGHLVFYRLVQVVFSNSVEVHLPTMNVLIMSLIWSRIRFSKDFNLEQSSALQWEKLRIIFSRLESMHSVSFVRFISSHGSRGCFVAHDLHWLSV